MGVRKILTLRKNIVYSDDDLGSLGIAGGEVIEFYEYIDKYEFTRNKNEFVLSVSLDNDVVEHYRSIYTFWDLLGDVGGLIDMLILLATPIISVSTFVFGSGLETSIIQSLFKQQKSI